MKKHIAILLILLLLLISCSKTDYNKIPISDQLKEVNNQAEIINDPYYGQYQMSEEGFYNKVKDNPIDEDYRVEFDKLQSSNEFSTQRWLELEDKYAKLWDAELNNTYNKLFAKLNPSEQKLLREAQKGWLQFHTNEADFVRESWGDLGLGTQGIVQLSMSSKDRIRNRTLQLMEYYALLGGEVEFVYKGQNASDPASVKVDDAQNKKQVGEAEGAAVDNSEAINDDTNKKENQIPEEYKKYLGYWQLSNRDLKYNDVIRGFSPPIEISSISDGIFNGSISFRMNDNYSMNPSCTIKIQEKIKDNKVNFEFKDKSFGSGNGVITLKDDTVEVAVKVNEVNEFAPFSIEGSGVYKRIPEENLNIATTPKDLFIYLRLNKKEMISKLGKDYKVITIDDGAFKRTGYYYRKYGLTFDFIDGDEYPASRVICDEIVEINGAKAKMNFKQIQQYLGKGYVFEAIDGRTPGQELKTYELQYKIYNQIIRFSSPYQDGKDSILNISYI